MRILLAVVPLLVAVPVLAQAPSNGSQVVCRSSVEPGSRLARTRICRTRAEWDNLRRNDRATIDRAQTRQFNRTIDEKGKMN